MKQQREYTAQPAEETRTQLTIVSVRDLNDATKACGYLREHNVVLVNCEQTNKENEARICDFLSGCVYALNGEFHAVSEHAYMLGANGVSFEVFTPKLLDEPFFFE